jgi:hypothetical protein
MFMEVALFVWEAIGITGWGGGYIVALLRPNSLAEAL